MAEATGKISCGTCGKSYRWKPQYAGKTLNCTCGAAINAPAAAAAAVAAASAATAAPTATAQKTAAAKPPAAALASPAPASSQDEFEKILAAAEYDVAPDPAPPPQRAAPRPAI